MPMLHFMNSLIKFAQSPTFYIVDFISIVNIWQGHLYHLYIIPTFIFYREDFNTLDPW